MTSSVKVLKNLGSSWVLRKGKFVKAQLRRAKVDGKEIRQYKTSTTPWRKTPKGMSFYS